MSDTDAEPQSETGDIRIVDISLEDYDKLAPEELAAADGKNYLELTEGEQEQYDNLSREKQKPYERPVPKEEFEELARGKEEINKR